MSKKKEIRSDENKKNENIIDSEILLKNENNLKFYLKSDFIKDSYACHTLPNTFTIFKSINDLLYLIYSTETNSIICYDLNKEKKYTEIKNAHEDWCVNLRHYLDTINKRDIIISLFGIDNLKLWDAKNFECIIYLSNINKVGLLYSAYLLRDNNINYIITSSYLSLKDVEPVKIFNLNGKLIKNIKNSNESTLILYNYFDKNLSKNYIITGNFNYIKSYDYTSNTIYHKYFDIKNDLFHTDIMIISDENIIKLIETCRDGYIRIWDFHSGLLLKRINLEEYGQQYSLCLWDNQHLLVGCKNNMILLNFHNNNLIYIFDNSIQLTIKKIYLYKYGECIISQGLGEDSIKIWINKK